jgi:hypothetical protein
MATKLRYQLRPAKHIERHMIVEIVRLLGHGFELDSYRYVGFGALEFMDFKLFHRSLGVKDMVSIEMDSFNMDRYLFNVPYSAIKLQFGSANEVLPALDWQDLNIVWLDYEKHLNSEILRDCEFLTRSLLPGSVLIVTVCATPERSGERLSRLRENVGEVLVPDNCDEKSLNVKGLPKIQKQILTGVINKVARNRNGNVSMKQILDFTYADDAAMQTLGWIVGAPSVQKAIASCPFHSLSFSRSTDDIEPFEISVPVLTAKESRHLNELLPNTDLGSIGVDWLSLPDQAKYQTFYRWYPEFFSLV